MARRAGWRKSNFHGETCTLCQRICTSFAIDLAGPDALVIAADRCVACGMCFYRCPNRNIKVVRTSSA